MITDISTMKRRVTAIVTLFGCLIGFFLFYFLPMLKEGGVELFKIHIHHWFWGLCGMCIMMFVIHKRPKLRRSPIPWLLLGFFIGVTVEGFIFHDGYAFRFME